MKPITINITEARLLNYFVKMNDNTPYVSATIGLFANGKQISDFSINTDDWNADKKFELPAAMIAPIKKIAKQLEEITALYCSNAIGYLGA